MSGLVDQAELEADGEVLLEPDLQVALALRGEQKVEGAHLAAVVGAAADDVVGAGEQLQVAGVRRSAAEKNNGCGEARACSTHSKRRGVTAP